MKRFMPLLALIVPIAAMAADPGGISVTDAWSRVTAGTSTPGVAYLTITDTGAADALTGVKQPDRRRRRRCTRAKPKTASAA